MTMRLPLTGGCCCGRVRYEIAAAPTALYCCHCKDCQRQSGSAFAMSMFVPRDSLAITAGTPKIWRRRADSGRFMQCVFCGDCGTRLYNEPESRPDVIVVKPGTLDDTSWLNPVGEIWTRSRQPWVPLPPGSPCFAEQADPTALAALWRARDDSSEAS
jgi:hypothetical protein